ncbi:hypothetical protein [Limnofasciculus baicalensis]|uniref:Uncharacterized protein n=1 Tax=Limnofasciculus baicalensis BBK-W-15 TaxID=2699891 RepID=A0AAE3GTW0_9CYAN|nr:hypothetical protein [Limnofasciculus baicalensis]MCP2730625.1 hypothetical protein [Limnofasciculus baicalensis BBK-W-15]
MNNSDSIDFEALEAITAIALAASKGSKRNPLEAWLDACKITALPWVNPFLNLMNFPDGLIEQQAVLRQIEEQLAQLREEDPHRDPEPLIREMRQQLANQTTPELASKFEEWVERHFIDWEISANLRNWRTILYRAVHDPSLSPPVGLQRLRAQIYQWFSPEQYEELESQLLHLAPPPSEKEKEVGLTSLCADALTIEEINYHESTISALKLLKIELTETEWNELMTWAETLGEEMGMLPEELQGYFLIH